MQSAASMLANVALPSANLVHFFISYAVAFIALGLTAAWYVWPSIKDRSPKAALTPLLLYSCLRVNGLMFLMPGLVSPDLPRDFAVPTAYGDLTAVILALIALAFVRTKSALALPMVWLFNIEGTLDLVYANISTFKDNVDPAQLGASYFLPAINVPAELIIHVMIFAYLLRAPRTRVAQA
jgi:hypothetical protein